MLLQFIVQNNNYSNINQILKQELNISSRLLQKLINSKHIYLNNNIVDTRNSVKLNDVISVNLDFDEESENIIPQKMNLNIVYEDESFLIVNKPPQIAIHPSILHYNDSLANGVKYYFDEINLHRKIRPVNRLDFNTSGLVLFAKNQYIQECLISQMKNHTFCKEYIAVVYGKFKEKSGIINLPIARKENSIIERCISETGQQAITHYEVLQEFTDISVVKCILETGRTHQIRLHMSAIGHPLIGDSMYGITSNFINRQALHSSKISFIHPISKEHMSFECSLPEDIQRLLHNGDSP